MLNLSKSTAFSDAITPRRRRHHHHRVALLPSQSHTPVICSAAAAKRALAAKSEAQHNLSVPTRDQLRLQLQLQLQEGTERVDATDCSF